MTTNPNRSTNPIRNAVMASVAAITLAIAAPSILAPPVAAQSWDSVSDETREAWQSFQAYSASEREEAIAAGERLLQSIDEDLDRLEARMDQARSQAAERWEARQIDLIRLRTELEAEIDRMQTPAENAWRELSDAIAQQFDELTNAIQAAWDDVAG